MFCFAKKKYELVCCEFLKYQFCCVQAADGFLFVVQCDTGRIIYVSDSITPVLNQSQVKMIFFCLFYRFDSLPVWSCVHLLRIWNYLYNFFSLWLSYSHLLIFFFISFYQEQCYIKSINNIDVCSTAFLLHFAGWPV